MPQVEIEGIQINYTVNRNKPLPGGQRICYVHGTGCNAEVFAAHIATLDRHQAVAIDLPGHGRSGGIGFRGVVDHMHYVAELIRILEWEDAVVAGHSMGGGIAIALALYHPTLLKGLILIDTGARLRVAPEVINNAAKIALGDGAGEKDSRLGFSPKTPQPLIDKLWKITADMDPHVTLKDWYADDSCDFLTRVSDISIPTLAICGRDDRLTPVKYHEYLATHISGCQLEVIDDAGHWPYLEQSDIFSDKIERFLATLS